MAVIVISPGEHQDYHSQFHAGQIFHGTISSVGGDCFYLVIDKTITPMGNVSLSPMFWTPAVGSSFLLNTTDGFFRATRLALDSIVEMKVFFVDTGETISMPFPHMPNIYEMPNEMIGIPHKAIKCRVNIIDDATQDDASAKSFLEQNIYENMIFRVTQIDDNELIVNIYTTDGSDSSSDVSDQSGSFDYEVLQDLPKSALKQEFEDDSDKSECDSDDLNFYVERTTPEEDIWFENGLNHLADGPKRSTDNAEIAIQGFKTKDDDKICKFYDPAIGGCFKGGRCNLRHVKELTDGSCRDQKNIRFENIEKSLRLPPLHETLPIEIICFTEVNKFICRYVDVGSKRNNSRTHSLDRLIKDMNRTNDDTGFQPYASGRPGLKELVVIKHSDGKFYRARVEEEFKFLEGDCEDDSIFKVFLVDLGIFKDVPYQSLFYWRLRFEYLEFQAVEIEIANIQQLASDTDPKQTMTKMMHHIEAHVAELQVLVLENLVGIKGKLMSGIEDIGELFCDIGWVQRKQVVAPLPYVKGSWVPG